jgi:hypothetical protein
MQSLGLPGRQLALARLVIDAPVLVLESIVDLVAARVMAFPEVSASALVPERPRTAMVATMMALAERFMRVSFEADRFAID